MNEAVGAWAGVIASVSGVDPATIVVPAVLVATVIGVTVFEP